MTDHSTRAIEIKDLCLQYGFTAHVYSVATYIWRDSRLIEVVATYGDWDWIEQCVVKLAMDSAWP